MSDSTLPDDVSQWPADPYEIFGISRSAGMRELRRAYAALIRRFKPEHHPQQFRRIRDAYESLEWQVRWRERGGSPEEIDAGDGIAEPAPAPQPAEHSAEQRQNETSAAPEQADEHRTIAQSRNVADIDAVWSRALKAGADWQDLYRRLVQAAETAATDEVLFCRLYWLRMVAPQVDAVRQPVDWLATGLARNAATPRLLSLYHEELSRRPAEALRERSRNLLTQPRPIWQLAELARHRWRALRVLDRLEEVTVDLRLLSPAFISAREEWVRLLMNAAEVLAWSDGDAAAMQLGECLREIDQTTDLQLGLSGALDRHELLLAVASEHRRWKDWLHRDFPKGIVQLIPELWLNSDSARLRLDEILESWVDEPQIALDGLESLHSVCRVTLTYLTDLLTSLVPRSNDDGSGVRRRAIENLIETHEWTYYRSCRDQLCQYCLRTGIWLDEILEVMHTDPDYADLAEGAASKYLREDLPLKCLLAGHRAFWR